MTNCKNTKKSVGFHIVFILSCIILIVIDQISKYLAYAYLKDTDGIDLISGVFRLQYLENRGAAFGILEDQKLFFILITILTLFIMGWLYMRISADRHYMPLYVVLAVFISGAIGNFIDRMRLNYVIDFFYFELIDFPIFNVADIYVTCGMVAFFLILMFYYKEEDLNQLEKQIIPWKKVKK